MKKILQFTIASTQGGHTQYITNIWRLMDKTKIHFDFVTFSKTIDFAKEFIDAGCEVYQISVHPEENMEAFVAEFEKILDYGYDAIEIHTSFWNGTIVERLVKQRDMKIIIHAHSTGISLGTDAEVEQMLEKHLDTKSKINKDFADYYFACSHAAADWLYGGVIPSEKIEIIHNTIDTNRFAFDENAREEMREKLQLGDKFVVGNVGRMVRVKNQKFLMEIFAEVCKKKTNAVLLLVGDGLLKETLEKQAEELGIGESVIFAGQKKDTELYYQVMDVFVLPSLIEGFPIVLLEAQCGGLKCLCSEAVPLEVNITGNVQRISLENRREWIWEIINASSEKNRKDQGHVMQEKGFDTNTQINDIEELYLRI